MTSVKEFFHTDVQAMTGMDWFGTVLTVVIFLLMVGLYWYVFSPKRGKKLNVYGSLPLDEKKFEDEVDK